MDGITQLAKMLKERDNALYMGPQVGKVVSPPPDLKVSLDGKIILTKEHLVIAAHVLAGYERSMEGVITLSETNCGTTTAETVGNHGSHSHGIASFTLNKTPYQGTIKWTDTLNVGDEVILIPSTDEQKYFLVDKVVRLP